MSNYKINPYLEFLWNRFDQWEFLSSYILLCSTYLLRASFLYLFVNIPYIFLSTIPSYAFSHFTTGYCDLPCDSFYGFIRRFNGHIICSTYTKYMLYNIVSNIFEKLLPFYYCSMRPYNTLKFFSFLHVLQVQVNN